MKIAVELNGAKQHAQVVLAKKDDLNFVSEWRTSLGADQNPYRKDSVEFAEIAIARFEAHVAIQPYATSTKDFVDHIATNPKCEVACIALLTCDWFRDSSVIGFVHFRRTWCNRIVLDYLAAHPFAVRPPESYQTLVRGVGPGLLYFVCTVAKECECDAIWGEATQGSCGFYKHVLKLDSVQDLIYAQRDKFLDMIDRKSVDWQDGTSGAAKARREEIYLAEAENPPFVGSRTAVFNPARRLAYRFLELPPHVQREIATALGLFQDDDRAKAVDAQFTLFFQRAAERGILADLWRQVEQRHPDGQPGTNPFVKLQN